MNENKRMSTKNAVRMLCICLAVILLSSLGASILQSSFGKVDVIDFKIPTENGTWITGHLFKPQEATADHQLPLVITCPGYMNNDEMQDSTAIELSRRGMVVMSYDPYYHGNSSSDNLPVIESTVTKGIGMIPLVEYAYHNLNYIDQDKIGVMGHSMGGMSVWFTLMYYGGQYYTALEEAKAPDSDGGEAITAQEMAAAQKLNKVNAGLASGNVRLSTEETFAMIHANVGINYGLYDEGNYDLTNGNGDLSGHSYEALSAVNSGLPESDRIDAVEIGKYYGTAADKNLRVIYNPEGTHQMQHFSAESTADNINFFTNAFEVENSIAVSNQLWLVKEIFNGIGLFALLIAIIPLTLLLLEIPCFNGMKNDAPAYFPALTNRKDKYMFWFSWGISWIISWLSYMPVTRLDQLIFPDTAAMGTASLFPQQSTNFIMLWAVFNGLIGLILYYGFYKKARKDGSQIEMFGIRTSMKNLIKTILLALIVFTIFYFIVGLTGYFFKTDFRLWFVAICSFSSDKLLVMLQYLPFYFIFFAANSLLTNSFYRRKGMKDRTGMILTGLGNVLGIILLNAMQYITLFTSGNALWGADRLYPLLALPLIPFLFIAPFFSRQLFKATGNVWLGAIINTLILVMVSVANTATLTPLL